MQIISINRAQKHQITFNGEQVGTGIFKTAVSGKVRVIRLGITGDTIADPSVHDGQNQAVYLYSVEDYQLWIAKLGKELPSGSFDENLTTEGPDLRALKIGDLLKAGEVLLEISAPRCNRHRSRGRALATTGLSNARAPREAQSHHALP